MLFFFLFLFTKGLLSDSAQGRSGMMGEGYEGEMG